MAKVDVHIHIPVLKVQEGSAFAAIAYFRDTAGAAGASATAKYRVDCLSTGKELTALTALTPAVSISIPITATHNAIQSQGNRFETKQLIVISDPGETDQTVDQATWRVENLHNVS